MNIVAVGNVCVDINSTENASYTAAGGPAVFMDKIFSQLPHVSATIVAPYGSDFLEVAPNLSLFPVHPMPFLTLVYENTVKKHIRTQRAYNRTHAEPIAVTDDLQQLLEKADIFFLTPLLPNISPEYVKQIVGYTKKDTLKVFLPQGYYRDFQADDQVILREFSEASHVLPYMDIVIVSEQDGNDMNRIAVEWSKKYNIIVIVTLGENGAVAIQGDRQTLLHTQPVAHEVVIDSVGSGDIFSASFAYAYKMTHSLERAGKFANNIARQCLYFKPNDIQIILPEL